MYALDRRRHTPLIWILKALGRKGKHRTVFVMVKQGMDKGPLPALPSASASVAFDLNLMVSDAPKCLLCQPGHDLNSRFKGGPCLPLCKEEEFRR